MLCAMPEPTENAHEEPEASEQTGDADAEQTDDEEATKRVTKKHSASPLRSVVAWLALAALVVALSSLGIALWALLRPPPTPERPPAPPGPSAQQVGDAKTKACDAYTTVQTAVNLRSNADPGPDPASAHAEVVFTNARQALTVGHSYLLSNLDPATPAPLAAAIRKFADQIEAVAIHALAGAKSDDPAQVSRIRDFVTLDEQITGLCK
jgi:hypothetical protein